MTVNPANLIRIFVAVFLITMATIAYHVYQHVMFLKDQRRQLIHNFYDAEVDNVSYDALAEEEFYEKKFRRNIIINMKADIKQLNLRQKVQNANFFYGITNITFIVVIQVHSNVYLLKNLIASLKSAHSIANALLIFSHNVYDSDVNDAVRTINFARYMQIFYPYSVQLHPYVYPGGQNVVKDNDHSEKPQRNPSAAQKKLHWWWQVNQVFDNLEVTKNHTNSILFLEEDNYVTEDFLIVFKLLEHVRDIHCPVCEMISMGAHTPEPSQYLNRTAVVALEIWAKSMPNIGVAFNRIIWRLIKNWSREFCVYNDYTWENSLKFLGSQHLDINFYFTDIIASRVFRVEDCRKGDWACNLTANIEHVKQFTKDIKPAMYPSLVVLRIVKSQDYVVDALGYFDDERDYELCMYFTKNLAWF